MAARSAGLARSSFHLLSSEVAQVDVHHRQDRDEEQRRERRAATVVEELEDLVEHPVGHDVVAEPSAGRHVDDVEDLERDDRDGRRDRDDRAADHRHDHPEEELALGGAVEPGRLEDLARHALDGGREDDHGETGLEPDQDHDLAEDVDRAGRQPRDRLPAEADHDRVQESDLRLAGGLPRVDEAPDHRCADERDRQRQEDDGLGQRLAPDAIEQPGDDEPEHHAAAGARRSAR